MEVTKRPIHEEEKITGPGVGADRADSGVCGAQRERPLADAVRTAVRAPVRLAGVHGAGPADDEPRRPAAGPARGNDAAEQRTVPDAVLAEAGLHVRHDLCPERGVPPVRRVRLAETPVRRYHHPAGHRHRPVRPPGAYAQTPAAGTTDGLPGQHRPAGLPGPGCVAAKAGFAAPAARGNGHPARDGHHRPDAPLHAGFTRPGRPGQLHLLCAESAGCLPDAEGATGARQYALRGDRRTPEIELRLRAAAVQDRPEPYLYRGPDGVWRPS